MSDYDPLRDPDPKEWRELDEGERILLVSDYHERAGIEVPNLRVHAVFHATVETQVAFGAEIPVRETLERLMTEGLDRHDAVHAIGSVLAEHMHGIMQDGGDTEEDTNAVYFEKLRDLTADEWLADDELLIPDVFEDDPDLER